MMTFSTPNSAIKVRKRSRIRSHRSNSASSSCAAQERLQHGAHPRALDLAQRRPQLGRDPAQVFDALVAVLGLERARVVDPPDVPVAVDQLVAGVAVDVVDQRVEHLQLRLDARPAEHVGRSPPSSRRASLRSSRLRPRPGASHPCPGAYGERPAAPGRSRAPAPARRRRTRRRSCRGSRGRTCRPDPACCAPRPPPFGTPRAPRRRHARAGP